MWGRAYLTLPKPTIAYHAIPAYPAKQKKDCIIAVLNFG